MNNHFLLPRGTADFDLYPYTPSAPAGYAFLAIFAIAAGVHFVLMMWTRNWFFVPFILGCIGTLPFHLPLPYLLTNAASILKQYRHCLTNIDFAGEAGGYYCRALSSRDIRAGTPYLVQMLLILGSAPLLAATVYMTLGRIMRALDAQHYSLIRSTLISKIYILIDVASFVCQILGTAAQASGPEGAAEGMRIVVIGLGIQLGAFAVFLLMLLVLHVRLLREPTLVAELSYVRWQRHVGMLYVVVLLIVARSIFRFVEFAQGSGGEIYKNETLMYVFDAALLSGTALGFALVHPGMLFRAVSKGARMSIQSQEDGLIPLDGYRK